MSSDHRIEEFDTPQPIRVRLSHRTGTIEIHAEPVTTTRIELTSDRSDRRVDEIIAQTKIVFHNGELAVVCPRSTQGWLARHPDVDLRLTLPIGSTIYATADAADLITQGALDALRFETKSGDVRLDDVTGDVSVKSASGDIDVRSAGGVATLNSASGDITVGTVSGKLTAFSASGDVTIDDAQSSAAIRSASGDLRIHRAQSGTIEARTASGDIDIDVAGGVGVWIDAGTHSGTIVSDLNIEGQPPVDGFGLKLTANSVSGGVRIGRAAPNPPVKTL